MGERCGICTAWCACRTLAAALDFYCAKLGLREVRRYEIARFTLVFLAAPGDAQAPQSQVADRTDEKGYAGGRNFGHLAYQVDDIYATCGRLMAAGVTINRPPRDWLDLPRSRSPDGIEALPAGMAIWRADQTIWA